MGFLIVTLLLFLGLVSQKAFADSRLIIVKYGLSLGATGFSENQTTNDGLQINNLPLDNLGNELSVLSGIHYLVYEISPTGDDSSKKVFGLLPKTGVASSLLLTSYGFVLFLIIICLKKRRKKEEEVK
ncbi:hypothetical protein V425_06445 [Lactococcus lactis RTB018]|nr:hypothetical protein V425_06445 [Lactococcus lactis RTB018]